MTLKTTNYKKKMIKYHKSSIKDRPKCFETIWKGVLFYRYM